MTLQPSVLRGVSALSTADQVAWWSSARVLSHALGAFDCQARLVLTGLLIAHSVHSACNHMELRRLHI